MGDARVPPDTLQRLIELAHAAALAVGPAAVLATLDALGQAAGDDVRAVTVEARHLARGGVSVTSSVESHRLCPRS